MGIHMTKFQRERQKFTDAAKEAGEKADAEADKIVAKGETILGKLKKSKLTAPVLAASGLVAAIAAFWIIK